MGIDWEEILGTDDNIGEAYEELAAKAADDDWYYVSGTWRGKTVRINDKWGDHYFTDQELKDLFDGKSIKINAYVNGRPQAVVGRLDHSWYKGSSRIGFVPSWKW